MKRGWTPLKRIQPRLTFLFVVAGQIFTRCHLCSVETNRLRLSFSVRAYACRSVFDSALKACRARFQSEAFAPSICFNRCFNCGLEGSPGRSGWLTVFVVVLHVLPFGEVGLGLEQFFAEID